MWLWLLCSAGALTQTGLNLLRPITSYKLIALDAGASSIGMVTALYALLPLITAIWLGKICDRTSSLRGLLLAGVATLSLGGAGLALAPHVAVIAVSSVFLGMGHLAFTITGQAVIARTANNTQLDAGFGWFTAAFSVGQMCGPMVGGFIVGTQPLTDSAYTVERINMALWVGGAVMLCAVLPCALTQTAQPLRGTSTGVSEASILRILRTKTVTPYMLGSLGLLAMIDIVTAFLPVLAEHADVAPAVAGVLLAVRGAASVVSRVFLPWLSPHIARHHLLKASLLISAFSFSVLPPAMGNAWAAAICLTVGGFFLGLGQPLTMSMITTAVPDSWRGSALAVRLMGNRLGQVAMPLLAGVVAVPLGPAAAIWLSCGVLAASGIERTLRDR